MMTTLSLMKKRVFISATVRLAQSGVSVLSPPGAFSSYKSALILALEPFLLEASGLWSNLWFFLLVYLKGLTP